MGQYYSMAKDHKKMYSLKGKKINSIRLKFFDSPEKIIIYLNVQTADFLKTFFIFDIYLDNEENNDLIPILEANDIFTTIIEPSRISHNDLVCIKTENELKILKREYSTEEFKVFSSFKDLNIYKKALWFNDDRRMLFGKALGDVSIFDVNSSTFTKCMNRPSDKKFDYSHTLEDLCLTEGSATMNTFCCSNKNGDLFLYDYYNKVKGAYLKKGLIGVNQRGNKEIFFNLNFNPTNYILSAAIKGGNATKIFDIRNPGSVLSTITFDSRQKIVQQRFCTHYQNCICTLFYDSNSVTLSKLDDEYNVDYNYNIFNEDVNDNNLFFDISSNYFLTQYNKMFEIYDLNDSNILMEV